MDFSDPLNRFDDVPSEVDAEGLQFLFCALLAMREAYGSDDEAAVPPPLRDALEKYRVAVTNKKATREGECASSRRALEAALQEHRLLETVKARATPAAGEATGQAQDKGDARSARTGRLGMGDYYTRMQRVVPGLYIGSYHPATDLEQLDGEGITHICCCIATPARFPGKHKYLMLNADDHPSQDMTQFFERAIAFIRDATHNNGRVLVHCGAGISRASTVTLAYLMHDLRLPLDQAYNLVKSVRPCIHPNPGFVKQLRAYEKQLGLAP